MRLFCGSCPSRTSVFIHSLQVRIRNWLRVLVGENRKSPSKYRHRPEGTFHTVSDLQTLVEDQAGVFRNRLSSAFTYRELFRELQIDRRGNDTSKALLRDLGKALSAMSKEGSWFSSTKISTIVRERDRFNRRCKHEYRFGKRWSEV